MKNVLVTVVGTIFMDCKGFAQSQYNPVGRNLGSIQFVHGGVGRNVVENLARAGVPVAFAASVDSTGVGKEIVDRLEKVGVSTDYLLHAPERGMGMWLAILDHNGDLAGSISQMPDLSLLHRLAFERGEGIVQHSSHIALELDLSEEISRRFVDLARRHGKPVYGVPGNLDVVMKHPDLLRGMDCFICNDIEAAKLLGAPLDGLSPDQLREQAARYATAAGLRSLVITMGALGSIYVDTIAKESGHQPVFPVNMVDSTGAGDAFYSGTVMGLVNGLPLREAVICGTKIAGWTIESSENNCPDLDQRMKQDAFFNE